MKNPFARFFHRQARHDDQVGLGWDEEGLAVVRVNDVRGEKPRIDTCLWQPWPEGTDIGHHLRQLAETHKLLKVPFNVCLRIEDYDLFPNDAADVPQSELATAMKWIVRDRLDFPLEEAVVDCFYIPDPIRMAPERKVYVIAARQEVVRAYLEAGRRARLNMQAIEVVELALNNIAAHLPEIGQGVAMLYYPPKGEAGSLIVAREDKLYLARRVSAVSQEALELGIDVTENIAAEVQRSLDYIEGNYTQSPIQALYLAAMPDQETFLRDGVGSRLNIRVKLLRALSLFESNLDLDQETVHRVLPALGEALRMMDEVT